MDTVLVFLRKTGRRQRAPGIKQEAFRENRNASFLREG